MIKNQEIKGTFPLVPPFYKWMNDKHLSELLSHLNFSLFASIYFVHVLDALSCNHIRFFSVLFPLMSQDVKLLTLSF